jgi:hypothetical protein
MGLQCLCLLFECHPRMHTLRGLLCLVLRTADERIGHGNQSNDRSSDKVRHGGEMTKRSQSSIVSPELEITQAVMSPHLRAAEPIASVARFRRACKMGVRLESPTCPALARRPDRPSFLDASPETPMICTDVRNEANDRFPEPEFHFGGGANRSAAPSLRPLDPAGAHRFGTACVFDTSRELSEDCAQIRNEPDVAREGLRIACPTSDRGPLPHRCDSRVSRASATPLRRTAGRQNKANPARMTDGLAIGPSENCRTEPWTPGTSGCMGANQRRRSEVDARPQPGVMANSPGEIDEPMLAFSLSKV